MIYYLYYTHSYVKNGEYISENTASAMRDAAKDFFIHNKGYAGEQGRSLSFWLGSDSDPN